MSNSNLFDDSARRLAEQADAVGRLAQDSGAFAAAVAAFDSRDPDAFRWVLEQTKLFPRCHLICEWIHIKLCVLRCFRVCGPPEKVDRPPPLYDFVQAVVRLASDEKMLRRVVDAVSCGDADAYRLAINELKLGPFCHLICRWVCSGIWRRFCEVVCFPHTVVLDPVSELRAAATALKEVIGDDKAFAAIAKAAEAFDCDGLRVVLAKTPFGRHCEIICWAICTWRCGWRCFELCEPRIPVLYGAQAIEEARQFALAARQLGGDPRSLRDVITAVNKGDATLYRDIVARFRLFPYCYQVCAWVCSVTCSEFCICLCPNPALDPWFTTVGWFNIYSDIDPMTGKANKSVLGVGGPNYAFFGHLVLGGFCPSTNSASVPMKYRFLFDKGTGATPITGGLVCEVKAGQRILFWPQKDVGGNAIGPPAAIPQDVIISAGPNPPDPVPPLNGDPWFPPSAHYLSPDANGWIEVDANAIGGGFHTLLCFDTTQPQAVPGGAAPHVPAGTAVPVASQLAGTDMSITFEATRVGSMPPADYTNALSKIRINNWGEVNELNFAEFVSGCCTPIDATLSVQFTVDHEEMDAGSWSLGITSCSPSAPGDITPAPGDPGVTITGRGGSGTIVLNTSAWENCSYTATLSTTPGLTTGLNNWGTWSHPLTFAICSH